MTIELNNIIIRTQLQPAAHNNHALGGAATNRPKLDWFCLSGSKKMVYIHSTTISPIIRAEIIHLQAVFGGRVAARCHWIRRVRWKKKSDSTQCEWVMVTVRCGNTNVRPNWVESSDMSCEMMSRRPGPVWCWCAVVFGERAEGKKGKQWEMEFGKAINLSKVSYFVFSSSSTFLSRISSCRIAHRRYSLEFHTHWLAGWFERLLLSLQNELCHILLLLQYVTMAIQLHHSL